MKKLFLVLFAFLLAVSSRAVDGTFFPSNVVVKGLVGSGDHVAADADGRLLRTNIVAGGGTGASTNQVLTNLIGTVARNVTNVVSLSTSNATSKPLTNSFTAGVLTLPGIEAGANTTITANGSNWVIASTASGSYPLGHSNAIPFMNGAGTALTYYDAGNALTNPGFGFDPRTLNGPNAGYGGLLVFANDSMGLVTIGHPNPGSDFAGDNSSALVISNRFAPANQDFTNHMVKIEAVEVLGGGAVAFNPDSTLTRWRVWGATSGAGSGTSTSSNDVAAITVDGRLKLAKGIEISGSSAYGSASFSSSTGTNFSIRVTNLDAGNIEYRWPKNTNAGVLVAVNEAGVNQLTNITLTAGQGVEFNGTNYVAGPLIYVHTDTNNPTVVVDWALAWSTYTVLGGGATNVSVWHTNTGASFAGRSISVEFQTNMISYALQVTNLALQPIRYSPNLLTNGYPTFVKTNTSHFSMVFTQPITNYIVADAAFYRR